MVPIYVMIKFILLSQQQCDTWDMGKRAGEEIGMLWLQGVRACKRV